MALNIAGMSSADYQLEHAKENRQMGMDAGGYFVGAHKDGEPAPAFFGGLARDFGITGVVSEDRAIEIVKATWNGLSHPETGEALGSGPRVYASREENLAKIATRAGYSLPEGMRPEDYAAARLAQARRGTTVEVPSLGELKDALSSQVEPEKIKKFVYQALKDTRDNVNYLDACFSPIKATSVAHLAAELAGDQATADAFESGFGVCGETLAAVLESDLVYARLGHHGASVGGVTSGRREKIDKVAIAGFIHHVSREGDPNDHAHYGVLNKVRCADGQYRAIDAQAMFHARASLDVVLSRTYEAHLRDQVPGLRFERGEKGTRSIVGVSQEVCDMFSKRTRVIDERLRQWAERYEARVGKAPDAQKRAEQANRIAKATRPKKPKGVSREEWRTRWQREATDRGESLTQVWESLTAARRKTLLGKDDPEEILSDAVIIERSLEALKARQTKFTRHHLIAEIDRHLPANIPVGMDAWSFFQRNHLRLAGLALRREGVVCLVPDQVIDQDVPADMANRDGLSLYLPRGQELYVDEAVLATEATLLAETLRCEARALSAAQAAAIAEAVGLEGDQAAALVGILSSARSLEVLLGPPGTGKSYLLSMLARTWENRVAHGAVVGLTVSENAADVLRTEGFQRATNLARWFKAQERIAAGKALAEDHKFVLKAGQLIVIDEASMASSADIGRVVDLARAYGAKVLLTGDHRQLAAVEQGGALGLLAEDPMLIEAGVIHELTTVRRFQAEWEREASLRLRDGDESVLDVYDDHGRIIVGTREKIEAELVADTTAHLLAGRVSCLSVDTAAEAAALSLRIRAELIDAGRVAKWSCAKLHDGTEASKGDLIQARKNAYEIKDSDGQALSNRDVLRVEGVDASGRVLARRLSAHGHGAQVVLSGKYVKEHVELAYASTVHGAQGRTVAAGAQLVDPETTTAEALLVGGTRGRLLNRFYVVMAEGDDRRGADVLKDVLARRGAAKTATEIRREQDDASRSLARLGPVWADAVGLDAANTYRDAVADGLKRGLGAAAGSALLDQVEADSSAPAFWQAVSVVAEDGYDVADTLASTLTGRNLDGAQSAAQVLHHRLTEWRHMAWEPAQSQVRKAAVGFETTYLERSPAPESLVSDLGRADHAGYARRLATAMDAREAELGHRVGATEPEWATKALGPVPVAGSSAYEDWVARAGVVAGYHEQYLSPTAPVNVANPLGPRPSRYRAPQRYIDWHRASEALGRSQERQVNITEVPDSQLIERIAAWNQAQELAPAWVPDEVLRDAHTLYRNRQTSYDRKVGTAAVIGRRLDRLAKEVEELGARVEALEVAKDERRRWYEDTTEVRDVADEARAELGRRYPNGEVRPDVAPAPLREEMDERQAQHYDDQIKRAERQAQLQAQRAAQRPRGVESIGLSLR